MLLGWPWRVRWSASPRRWGMKGDAQAILAIAASIADGEDLKDINWQQLEAGPLTEEDRTVLRSLRLIASIGDLHRSTDDEEQDNVTAFFAHRARIVGRIGPAAQARSGPPTIAPAAIPSAPASASPSSSSASSNSSTT